MRDLYRLLQLFKPYYNWLALGVFLSLITLLANVALLAISGWFITAMAVAGVAGVAMNYFTPAALIRAAAIIRTAGRYAERLVTHEATFRLLAELRVWFYQHLEPLAPAGLEIYQSGDLLSRIRADIDTLNNVYLRFFIPVAVFLISSILFVFFLTLYNPLLAFVEFSLLFLAGILVPWWVNRMAFQSGQKITQTNSQLRTSIISDMQGMGELLIYGASESHADHIKQLSRQLAKQQQIMSKISGLSQAALSLCASLAMWLSVIIVIPMVSNGSLPPANLVMLALFVLASFEAVMPLPFAFQSLGETLEATRRLFSITDKQSTVHEPDNPIAIKDDLHIKFKHVSFFYSAETSNVLTDITLEIKPGGTLAIVGLTGSGKTSLINLLLRFYPISSGEIVINQKPIESYDSEELRKKIAVLTQHNHLFNTSIRENLLLAKPNATQEEIETVCRTVQLHSFIKEQPQAYNTLIGEIGVRLSGGQIQRLAIARALLKPASLLILDEPTEGLDPQIAKTILQNIYDWAEQHKLGIIIITHDLKGIEKSDQIIVLDEGKIAENGKHKDLQRAGGIYQRLWEFSQLID